MKLDLRKYSVNREFIQNWYRGHPNQSITDMVSLWAISTHCPCVILCHYIGEIANYPPEVRVMIDKLTVFYGYTEILGQIDESPYKKSGG